jgi:hypothetical protein
MILSGGKRGPVLEVGAVVQVRSDYARATAAPRRQDPAMTLATVDRLVHHSTIFEMNVESHRRRTAIERKQIGAGRPASYATPKNVSVPKPTDNQPSI